MAEAAIETGGYHTNVSDPSSGFVEATIRSPELLPWFRRHIEHTYLLDLTRRFKEYLCNLCLRALVTEI